MKNDKMHTQSLTQAEKLQWLQLIQSENVGPKTFFDLLNHFGSAERALEAAPELSRRGGAKRAIKICSQDKAIAWLDALDTYGGELVPYGSINYPRALSHTDPPPPLLFMKGNPELANRPVVSIVGSRNASAIGLKMARNFASEIGMAQMSICSGLARGIDTAAHEASLSTGTIAVLAGGIDHIYPPENNRLHEEISQNGLLISEMVPGTVPQAQHFPRRNRIISGVALGVIIVEAAKRSGSLITARFAAEQGREVFAVPGSPLDPRAGGTNQLIQNGATLALEPADIIENIRPLTERGFDETNGMPEPIYAQNGADKSAHHAGKHGAVINDKTRDKLLSLLSTTPICLDDIIRESGEEPAHIHLVVLELELADRLMRHAGNQISLI